MRSQPFLLTLVIAVAALAGQSANAQQRMFKCVDAKGKTYYTQVPPPECLGKNTQELSTQGRVVKENEVLTPAERAARDAQTRKKAEQERVSADERRRNAALLNTYSTEKDIDEARARSIRQVQETMKSVELSITAARDRLARYEKEKEFYAKSKIPPKLQQDIDNANLEIRNQGGLLDSKKKEIDNLNAKYDDDKKRFIELTRVDAKIDAKK